MYKSQFFYIALIAIAFTFASCDKDDDVVVPEATVNIADLAIDNGFSSLAAALTKAELVDHLQGAGPFTFFAPTNEAFEAFLTEIVQNSIDDIPAAVLDQILLYHVLAANVTSLDISPGTVNTLQGESIALET